MSVSLRTRSQINKRINFGSSASFVCYFGAAKLIISVNFRKGIDENFSLSHSKEWKLYITLFYQFCLLCSVSEIRNEFVGRHLGFLWPCMLRHKWDHAGFLFGQFWKIVALKCTFSSVFEMVGYLKTVTPISNCYLAT